MLSLIGGRTSLPVSGLSSPTALTLAALASHQVADPRLATSGAAGVPMRVALCALALLLSGALQILLAQVALLVLVAGTVVHLQWSATGGLPVAGATIDPLPPAWPWAPPLVSLRGWWAQ